jgi:uncharacterized protein YecE (DUF72 family)
MKGRAFIGTSGWIYKHWRGEIFEPGFAQRRWLGRVAELFDTVEVNTSFYKVPKPETVESWVAGTPDSFLFALKLWRGITHYRKLVNAGDLTERFLLSADAVPAHRRAPLLIQLPPNQKPNLPKLEAYVHEFRNLSGNGWRIAVEFREDSWLQPATYELMDRLEVALCLHDMHGKAANDHANRAPFVYIRRHGSSEQLYAGSYSPEAIQRDAERIESWTEEGRDVFVYYNNDIGGHAFRNALDLRSVLRLAP